MKREFRGAEETEGDVHRSEAGIDVEMDVTDAMVTEDVFVAKIRGSNGSKERSTNLAAVGVA